MKNGWTETTIGAVCDSVEYGTSAKSKTRGRVPVLRMGNIQNGEIDWSDLVFTDDDADIQRYSLQEGDVLFNRTNSAEHVGKTCIYRGDRPAAFAGYLIRIHYDRERVVGDFLNYYLNSERARDYGKTVMSRSVNQANISGAKLKQYRIPLPPLPEQRRIVGILDEAFAGIATARANAEQNLQNARALFESHLNAVFTQRGNGWDDTTLGEACENLDSKRVPITKNKRVSGEYPYYGASGIVDYVNDYIFDEDLLLVSEDGANLLARTYPIAFSVSGKVWVNNHAHVLRFPDLASQRFMEFYLNSIKLDPYVSGMAQPKLNQKSLNSIPVPSPSLPERKAIVSQLESLRAETQRLESIYQRKLAALDELKKSLLHQAFGGQLSARPDTQEAIE